MICPTFIHALKTTASWYFNLNLAASAAQVVFFFWGGMLTSLFIGDGIRESSVFTLGSPQYGRLVRDHKRTRECPRSAPFSCSAFTCCFQHLSRNIFWPGSVCSAQGLMELFTWSPEGGVTAATDADAPPRGRGQRRNHNKFDVTRPCGWYESYTEVESQQEGVGAKKSV